MERAGSLPSIHAHAYRRGSTPAPAGDAGEPPAPAPHDAYAHGHYPADAQAPPPYHQPPYAPAQGAPPPPGPAPQASGSHSQPYTAPSSPAPSIPINLPRHTYTRTLVGPLSANACRLNDEHRKPGIFFLFQDLSIRTEGTFRLRLRLMNVGACVQCPLSPFFIWF